MRDVAPKVQVGEGCIDSYLESTTGRAKCYVLKQSSVESQFLRPSREKVLYTLHSTIPVGTCTLLASAPIPTVSYNSP